MPVLVTSVRSRLPAIFVIGQSMVDIIAETNSLMNIDSCSVDRRTSLSGTSILRDHFAVRQYPQFGPPSLCEAKPNLPYRGWYSFLFKVKILQEM